MKWASQIYTTQPSPFHQCSKFENSWNTIYLLWYAKLIAGGTQTMAATANSDSSSSRSVYFDHVYTTDNMKMTTKCSIACTRNAYFSEICKWTISLCISRCHYDSVESYAVWLTRLAICASFGSMSLCSAIAHLAFTQHSNTQAHTKQ